MKTPKERFLVSETPSITALQHGIAAGMARTVRDGIAFLMEEMALMLLVPQSALKVVRLNAVWYASAIGEG